MGKKSVITVGQLFVMLFISRMVVNLTYNPLMAGGDTMWEHLLSAGISFLLTFVLIIPVYKLTASHQGLDIAGYSYFLLGKLGGAVVLIYAVYYFLVSCYTLSLFDSFVSNVISPQVSLIALSLAVIIVSCYGAYRGIEAIARTSGLILVLICVAVIFIVIALLPKMNSVNYTPLLYDGPQQMTNGVMLMIARTSCIPALAMLLPMATGNAKKGIFWWNTAVYVSIALMITLMVGALGDYLKTQTFPVYAATSVAEIGMLKRLDAFYLGVWTTGLFIKIALFLYLFSLCMQRMFGKKAGKISILLAGAAVTVLSVLITESRKLSYLIYNLRFLLLFTILVAFVIPVCFLIADTIKRKRREKEHEA